MMGKKKLKYDVKIVRDEAVESFNKNLDISNKFEQGVIRLVITLSSSSLIITIALVEKLFPSFEGVGKLPVFLIISWLLFLFSIIFGIVAWVNESIFFANQARKDMKTIRQCNIKLSQGIFEDTIIEGENDEHEDLIVTGIHWDAICINAFVSAIIFMSFALLGISSPIKAWIIIIILHFFLAALNFHLLNKRGKI